MFCKKVIQNRNAKVCAEEVTQEAIDGPSFPKPKLKEKLSMEQQRHRWTIDLSTDHDVGSLIGSENMPG